MPRNGKYDLAPPFQYTEKDDLLKTYNRKKFIITLIVTNDLPWPTLDGSNKTSYTTTP